MFNPDCWWPSRYGECDQVGTLNEIGPTQIVAAARLVRAGTVYDLGRTLHADVPRFPGRFWQQTLVPTAHLNNARRPDGEPEGWGRNHVNWMTELVTGTLQIGTQLDGLNHLQYVVDSGFFPSSSSVNPSQTIITNALRVGDHLLERMGVIAMADAATR